MPATTPSVFPANGDLRAHLVEHGYLVVPGVVPAALCDAVVAATCAFVGVDIDDAATWPNCQAQGHGIVPLHHHQSLWDVRQLPALHAVFAAVYGTPALWVTLDRVSFKLPTSLRAEPFRMDGVHWDGDPRRDAPLAVQGLVYLTDTPAEQGAFAMVPSLYRDLDAWLAPGRSDAEVARPDVRGHELVRVPGRQGDLVLWHRRMPHTSTPNDGTRPRLVQYVSMDPAPAADTPDAEAMHKKHARLTLERHPPAWALRQRVPGQQDPEPGPALRLDALGRRLAGIDRW